MSKIILEKSIDAAACGFQPIVRFQIPLMGVRPDGYAAWLSIHLKNFIRRLSDSTKNTKHADRFVEFPAIEEEYPLPFCVGEALFECCVVCLYHEERGRNPEDWTGIVFKSTKKYPCAVNDLYLLAEKFEGYLLSEQVFHQRFGREEGLFEVEQATRF